MPSSRQWSPIVIAAALLLSLAAGGCSFMFSEGAPNRHEGLVYFNCGESSAPPIADSVVAGLSLLTAMAVRNSDEVANPTLAAATYLGWAVLTGASAVYGYRAVSSCKEAQGLRLARNVQQQALPPPYGLPPYGQPPPVWPPPRFELKTPAAAPPPAAVPPAAAPPAPPTPAPAPAP